MSTGISISSINRIKELVEQKKYAEALEILDTQNLDKSINPQFLKISGEIFRENKRYYDSRRILLKAHKMAPQGIRIIHELILLYLELGYFSLAQKYYEQYLFYTTPDDTQKDYVEYVIKKATGADVKDLASILIPILERMPEDKWNFEAILLYDKMERKDMALEESKYILENFKESQYIPRVIEYIDDKLDVDKNFYVYPREEQEEEEALFKDLIALEQEILEADYRLMNPPEARIMVEADDFDAIPVIPIKEKKTKKRPKRTQSKKKEVVDDTKSEGVQPQQDETAKDTADNNTEKEKQVDATEQSMEESTSKDVQTAGTVQDVVVASSQEKDTLANTDDNKQDASVKADDSNTDKTDTSVDVVEQTSDQAFEEPVVVTQQDETIQTERNQTLEKILSKKFDSSKLKESAKQMAQAMKDLRSSKTKEQVEQVKENVKENVKKASDVFGEAVGTKKAQETNVSVNMSSSNDDDEIMDGIIESVLEPPKKAVGEVVMNEELDALIPDSLEAMSEKEIAEIEAKKEELERLELEALEASVKMEEEKKAKKLAKAKARKGDEDSVSDTEDTDTSSGTDSSSEANSVSATETSQSQQQDKSEADQDTASDVNSEMESDDDNKDQHTDDSRDESTSLQYTYEELKNLFMKKEEDKPLDSLGFISVVHSDVDDKLEEAMPDAAGMLRQMIDNKEYYEGDSSLEFESKASYENHGFEVENFDFDVYRNRDNNGLFKNVIEESDTSTNHVEEPVKEIFTKEGVIDFEEAITEKEATASVNESSNQEIPEQETFAEEPIPEETVAEEAVVEETIAEEVVTEELIPEETIAEEVVTEELIPEEAVAEEVVIEEPIPEEAVTEEVVIEEPIPEEAVAEEVVTEEPIPEEAVAEEVVIEEPISEELISDAMVVEEPFEDTNATFGSQVADDSAVVIEFDKANWVQSEQPVIEKPLSVEDYVAEVQAAMKLLESDEPDYVSDSMIDDVYTEFEDDILSDSNVYQKQELSYDTPVEESFSVDTNISDHSQLYYDGNESFESTSFDHDTVSFIGDSSDTDTYATQELSYETPVGESLYHEETSATYQSERDFSVEEMSNTDDIYTADESTYTLDKDSIQYNDIDNTESVSFTQENRDNYQSVNDNYNVNFVINDSMQLRRETIRREIVLTSKMNYCLQQLKESR